MSHSLEKSVRTIKTNSILLDLCILFGEKPTDDEAGAFMVDLLATLVDLELAPDALGYNSNECLYTLTYRHFVEFAKVAESMRSVVKEMGKVLSREKRRQQMDFSKFGTIKPDLPKNPKPASE